MTRHIKLLALFFCSYLAILAYPISYLFSPLITVSTHRILLIAILLLTLPVYAVGLLHFGASLFKDTIKLVFFKGNVLHRVFGSVIVFLLLGLLNGIVITSVTSIEAIPFAYWNPVFEGTVLVVVLFSLLLQLAVLQSYRQSLPSQDEITEAFDQAEEALRQAEQNETETSEE